MAAPAATRRWRVEGRRHAAVFHSSGTASEALTRSPLLCTLPLILQHCPRSPSWCFALCCVARRLIGQWISLSCGLILFNKYLLANYGFPYPLALTLMHMGFCSVLATGVIKGGFAKGIDIDWGTYFRAIVPIGVLYSVSLWTGNSAYIYLSVSFIQMLKALMPVLVFCVGCVMQTEKFSWRLMGNMSIITVGVMIASYGELRFNMIGFIFQISCLIFESTRLALIQILLQRRGLKLTPITSMYLVSPACFFSLLVPFVFIELPKISNDPNVTWSGGIFLANCLVAFGLNIAVYLLVGKTSALTMNVAGVIKDWLLIGLSVVLFAAPVSGLQIGGYLIAFGGVAFYNYNKIMEKQKQAALEAKSEDSLPLVDRGAGPSGTK